MAHIGTSISDNNTQFKENYKGMLKLLERLEEVRKESLFEGDVKSIKRHQDQAKMTARKRVDALLDSDQKAIELMPFAGYGKKNVAVGASLVVFLGKIQGRYSLVCANVPSIKGGALNLSSVEKMHRVHEIALENRLPTVYLVESAGADLSQQAQVFNAGGRIFRGISQRSKQGIPSISVVFGSSTAGGAYIPGMSDYIVMVKDQSHMYLAGPPLVKMAINEETDEQDLGGATMHSTSSGVSDYLAENEEEAIDMARDIFSSFPLDGLRENEFKEPLFPADEILGCLSSEASGFFSSREVIARLVDGSEFLEFKSSYGKTLVTGFASIHGHSIGIISNEGVLWPESALKGAHFIQLCNQRKVPIIFLQNITGFMVGKNVEHQGIIKEGAKMINAVSNSEVPAITIMMGSSYGAGNYAMCGRAFAPRFLMSWPNSKLAVMGAEQLAGVLERVQRDKAEKSGIDLDEEKIEQAKQALISQVEKESDPFFVSGQLWDDGVIDPRETRSVLGTLLQVISIDENPNGNPSYGVFRM